MGRIVKGTMGSEKVAATTTATTAAMEEVAAILAAARAVANQERAAARDAAVLLARKMAEKIVGHAVAVDPKIMREIAARALDAAKPGRESVLLRVHPDDLASLAGTQAEWLAEAGVKADVKLIADAAVGRSGCVVETAVGRLDARLQTQLDALERALRGAGIVRA
jgi:flagellar assembly protein FliH